MSESATTGLEPATFPAGLLYLIELRGVPPSSNFACPLQTVS